MLVYFKVGNFGSVNGPVTINFNAAAFGEFTDSNVYVKNKTPLLKTIMLYGHNASGKSKILDAFAFFRWFVVNSARETQAKEKIAVKPFELSDSTVDAPSFFEIGFILGKHKYRYGFEADRYFVHKEWLLETSIRKEHPVFLRIGDEFKIDHKRLDNATNLERKTRKNALFLSVASQWNVAKAEAINVWISDIMFVHGLREDSYRELTIEALREKKFASLVNGFIKNADLGIESVEVSSFQPSAKHIPDLGLHGRQETFSKASEADKNIPLSIHVKYLNGYGNHVPHRFDLDEMESDGTIKLFNVAGVIIKAILENKVVIIDEFDARLHTLVGKSILRLFNSNKIKSSAQLLAACHDTALLDNGLLRRDQIYFVEKDDFGATGLTSLAEYKSRKDSPIDKNYLAGKYGAVPFLNNLEDLFADEQQKKC